MGSVLHLECPALALAPGLCATGAKEVVAAKSAIAPPLLADRLSATAATRYCRGGQDGISMEGRGQPQGRTSSDRGGASCALILFIISSSKTERGSSMMAACSIPCLGAVQRSQHSHHRAH